MMNADAARQMTEKALRPVSEVIRPYLTHVELKIKSAAEKGKREISHPLSGFPRGNWPGADITAAVRKALEANGYTWTHHTDPDPGDPRSGGDYDTVSW